MLSNDIQLTIRDDGCGFDPEQRSNTSLGLNIMQERATAIGASLRLESRIGQGTTVTVVWPNSKKGTHP
jgi:signal transduction histidine kinase